MTQVKPYLYQRCHFAGTIWTIVYIEHGHVHLTSLDGKQTKQHIAISEIQLIDEFDDVYPEE
jgi:hypothetical protein